MRIHRKGRRTRFVVMLLIAALFAQLLPLYPGKSNTASAAELADLMASVTAEPTKTVPAETAPAQTDIAGHWAESAILSWLRAGLVSGFPDGKFHPDGKVNRAELAAMINRVFQYKIASKVSFADVPSAKWYAADVARAVAAGYMQGDGKGLFHPEAPVTRGEVAVVIARLLKLDTKSESVAAKFADAKGIASWSRGAISAVVAAGVMKGYDGNLFKANQPLTRAESVVILQRVQEKSVGGKAIPSSIDLAGTYGPASGTEIVAGNVAINSPNVVLRNVTIKGDLLLGEGIGEGDATLDHVVVEDETTVKGGGKNSVHIMDSTLARVVITKVDGQVRVVIEGSTAVDQVTVESGATLQVASGSGASYGTVKVSTTGEVTLTGDFPDVVLVAAAQLTVTGGKVDNLTLTDQAAGADITLQKNVQIGTLNADAASTIKGDGKIATASITATGVTIDQKPAQTIIADGIAVNVGGTVTQGGGTDSGGAPRIKAVAVTVANPTAGGFDLKLSPAVPNLTAANLIMVNADGMPALVSKVSSANDGANYRAEGFLTGGATYTLSLAKPGYMFGGSKTIVIPDVPAITGAIINPGLTKVTLLFSKPLASLPGAPAGFSVTSSGTPVAITGVTLSQSATRIELSLAAPIQPSALVLSYVPGTIQSTDSKALPATTYRMFTDGSTPAGRVSYDRMLGMTAEEAAADLKDNASVEASAASKALIDGGYNTNGLIKALNTVYHITNENMPSLLLPQGISVLNLLIGMKEAGILNVQNLGKNFSYLDGNSDDWVNALKLTGYTDEQVVSYSWFFPNVKLAASLRTYYGTDNVRAAKLFAVYTYSSFSNDVGRVLKEVYANDDWTAVSALKAAAIDTSRAGQMLRDTYEAAPDRAAGLLKDNGYAAADIGTMLIQDYGITSQETVKAMRSGGFAIRDIWSGLAYAESPVAALRSSFTSVEVYNFLYSLDHRSDTVISSMKYGGFTAVETATALMLANPDIKTKAVLMAQLMQTDPGSAATYRYDAADALDAVRKKFGGTLTELAALLVQFGASTVTTKLPGQVTVVEGLARAGFNSGDIVQWLAPSNTLTQAQATNVVLELRNAGYPLSSLSNVMKTLSLKVYSSSYSPNIVRVLAASGLNTTTSEAIPGYTATEIAKFLSGAGYGNYTDVTTDLQLVYSKTETARAIAEATGYSAVDMLYFLNLTGLYRGASDIQVLSQVLQDGYGLSADEAVRTLKGSYVTVMQDFGTIVDVLKRGYGHTDTIELIHDLAAGGYTTSQIGDGLVLNGAVFKDAGYSSTEVAKYLLYKRTSMNDMALSLRNLDYNLTEITTALYNLYTGAQDQVVPQVTSWLSNELLGYSSDEVTAAVTAIFNVDPFSSMAQSLFWGSNSATQAAVTLKELFRDKDAIAMARGLKAAGYSRDNVLIGIFQAYCDGYIYKEGALQTMQDVIVTVYPEVTNVLEATLKASDVRTSKYAISVMKSMGKTFEDTIAVLEHVYGLNADAVLNAMMDNRLFGISEDMIVNKVGTYYNLDPIKLYIGWMVAHQYKAYDVQAIVQQAFHITDGVVIAKLLNQAGYTKANILFALDYNFHGDVEEAMAQVLVQLFGSTDVQGVAAELLQWGYLGELVYPALKKALPSKSQGEILIAMKQAGFTDLYDAARSISKGDSTAIMQFRNLGFSVVDAEHLLEGTWQYNLRDTIRYLIDAGYPLSDIGRQLNRPQEIANTMRAMNYSFDQITTVTFAADPRPSMMPEYLYMAGYTNIDDLVKALAIIHEDPKKYIYDLWSAKMGLNSIPNKPVTSGPSYSAWTATTLAVAVSKNSPLTLVDLGRAFLDSQFFNNKAIYEALQSVADIGVSFIQADLDSAISAMLTDLRDGIPFAIMHEAGLSSNDAARVMKQFGWDWIPACIQLVQAGYSAGDTWDALWDVYHNELGFQILNVMSAVAPLASLGLAENLTTFQSVTRAALKKAMMDYFTHR
ncbi:S-layer homology domain-containing protein [Paenibacillus albus]|uniref:SLH domain-containing protein n=1 Tax=Paenibacillus albus TaxID=2495582 RepID=A0A3Q8X2T7_9BACL|nr:S-layer homology domain-containing protein [Paenibacillus albus]AZN39164.1 hypothetical protein EJC50_05420 [Paenibacillus albus]